MKVARTIVVALLAAAAVVNGVDDLAVRLRNKPGADVQIERFLAVAQKFNKIGYERTDPVTEHCVYALLPHFGSNPCWYVTRHTVRFVRVG